MKNNITTKELFERLIALETKLDMKTENDKIVARRFKSFTYIIIFIEVINFVFNLLLYAEIK